MSTTVRKRAPAKEPKPKLRVWHIPQIPGEPFRVPVSSVKEASLLLRALARYDAFQLQHNIKPDYASAQGLEEFSGGEWSEWCNSDGDTIREVMLRPS